MGHRNTSTLSKDPAYEDFIAIFTKRLLSYLELHRYVPGAVKQLTQDSYIQRIAPADFFDKFDFDKPETVQEFFHNGYFSDFYVGVTDRLETMSSMDATVVKIFSVLLATYAFERKLVSDSIYNV